MKNAIQFVWIAAKPPNKLCFLESKRFGDSFVTVIYVCPKVIKIWFQNHPQRYGKLDSY